MMDDEMTEIQRRIAEANERRGKTFHGHAIANANEDRGGRFAYSGQSTSVTGSGPGSVYPRQPAGSPWANDPIGPEPLIDGTSEGNVLGYRIDDMGPGDASNADLPRAASDARANDPIRLRRRV